MKNLLRAPISLAGKRLLHTTAALLATGLTACAAVAADDFPKGTVKMVIPATPGGTFDTVGRLIALKLHENWGKPVVLDFKPGAGTIIGVDLVAKSAPDGHTFAMVNSALVVNPSLRKQLPYDTTKDLAGITQIANLQLAIVARPDAPFNTLGELIAYAKKNPEKLTYGTPGTGSTTHLGAELLKREAGFEMLHIPFKGSAPAHTELLGGRIDVVVDPLFVVLPYVKAGRMKMIATMGERRAAGFDFPTVAETVSGVSVPALLGFVAPRGTPQPVVQKIQADVAKVLRDPEVRRRIEEQGMEVVASRPAEFDAFVRTEIGRWARVIQAAGIQAD